MYKAAHFCRPFSPIFFLFACASTYHLGIFLCQNMKLCSVCFSLQCCQFVLYYFVQNLFEFKARGTKVLFFREIHFTKISNDTPTKHYLHFENRVIQRLASIMELWPNYYFMICLKGWHPMIRFLT